MKDPTRRSETRSDDTMAKHLSKIDRGSIVKGLVRQQKDLVLNSTANREPVKVAED